MQPAAARGRRWGAVLVLPSADMTAGAYCQCCATAAFHAMTREACQRHRSGNSHCRDTQAGSLFISVSCGAALSSQCQTAAPRAPYVVFAVPPAVLPSNAVCLSAHSRDADQAFSQPESRYSACSSPSIVLLLVNNEDSIDCWFGSQKPGRVGESERIMAVTG